MKKWDRPTVTVVGVKCTKENSIQPRDGNNRCRCCEFETGWGDATDNYYSLMEHYRINPTHKNGVFTS